VLSIVLQHTVFTTYLYFLINDFVKQDIRFVKHVSTHFKSSIKHIDCVSSCIMHVITHVMQVITTAMHYTVFPV
jgi:hypothetical protein